MVMTSFAQLREHLLQAHAENKLSHAYAIVGPAGSGKELLVKQLFAQMYGEQARQFANTVWISPIEGEEGAKSKKDISIEQIREVRTALSGGSLFGGHRVVVITPADAMNTAAANGLLKVLEEAPRNTTFMVLLQDWKAIPETVLSRCQVFGLAPSSAEEADTVLSVYSDDAEQRRRAVKVAFGLLGHAHDILVDSEFAQERFAHTNLFYELRGKPIHEQRKHIEPLLGDKKDHVKQRRLLDRVFATWQCEAAVVMRDQIAQSQSGQKLAQLITHLGKARHDVMHNIHPKIIFENVMFSFYDAV